jgi:SpoVK/Ycf46/Vps4 family AAA+-type ATPase
VEVDRSGLVAGYVGQTAIKTQEQISAALGGVLFIDEAYSLLDDKGGMYGDEAINTIVQEMENNREDTIVIFAGYSNEMEKFMERNPGLRSRIAFHVHFEDYNTEELCEIGKLMVTKNGMKLDGEAEKKMEVIFDAARQQEDFGNGRYVRNTIEKARMKQASRLMRMDIPKLTSEDVATFLAEDFEVPKGAKKEKQRIGFVGGEK